eukprot:1416967-Pleurochrysis_carterae.AAC.3
MQEEVGAGADGKGVGLMAPRLALLHLDTLKVLGGGAADIDGARRVARRVDRAAKVDKPHARLRPAGAAHALCAVERRRVGARDEHVVGLQVRVDDANRVELLTARHEGKSRICNNGVRGSTLPG